MKRAFILFLVIAVFSACESEDDRINDMLIDNTWVNLSNINSQKTLVNFKADGTYSKTIFGSLTHLPNVSGLIEFGTITGEWSCSDYEITFSTEEIAPAGDYNLNIGSGIISTEEPPIGVTYDTLVINGSIILSDLQYEPVVWEIEDINDQKLKIKTDNQLIEFIKE